ncbi:hypothetical protein [Phaeodactylibacter luteus]|uniref:Uncharacterized protein n=1 Tax=Phaeodactylibacter luteus TaxID=1564516 RepID=A0A5C6RLE0_9BACT|nr:hypothetical protein [Phaeodactylibacter luteus]TXB63156.1 hypothetical protein FRY97_10110 [Phaeodactylibacter luteus]
MKKRKLSINQFESARLEKGKAVKVKGGYKYSPSGPGFTGSFIWEGVDVRNELIQRDLKSDTNKQSTLFG